MFRNGRLVALCRRRFLVRRVVGGENCCLGLRDCSAVAGVGKRGLCWTKAVRRTLRTASDCDGGDDSRRARRTDSRPCSKAETETFLGGCSESDCFLASMRGFLLVVFANLAVVAVVELEEQDQVPRVSRPLL